MKKYLFIDRDGTLILEPEDEQIDSLEKLEFYSGVFAGLGKIADSGNFELVMITNQDGLGTSDFPEEEFWPAHNKMIQALENENIHFEEVLIDRSYPEDKLLTRKPGTGLLQSYLEKGFDKSQSFVIGDRISDMELARNLDCKGILLNNGSLKEEVSKNKLDEVCVLITTDWKEIEKYLSYGGRTGKVHRKTKETDIEISINLDGRGESSIHTGLGFLDHMLEQIARHGMIDLEVNVKGDLNIDEHHTIEDTALTLGECFSQALENKKGLFRYGFVLPMDDCLAQVAVDFGGRPWLVWDVEFKREMIGDVPTEMFMHFFKSFSDTSKSNLNIKAEGNNEHHKIEAIFKSFARAVRMAIRVEKEHMELPSTKGLL